MGSEFSLIEQFRAAFDPPRAQVGPGDDCAVLAPPRAPLAVTTDAVVENVHFTRATFSLEDVGHKALAVNLSDLAAMGARPAWFLVAIAMPRSFGAREVRALARGMAPLARTHRASLVGGNFTAAGELSVTVTAAGLLPGGKMLPRSGGRAGDALYVSGTLGDARLGLELLGEQGKRRRSGAVERQRRPQPRVALGQLALRFARAGIDLSDGLAQDAGHLAAASGCAARFALEAVPLSTQLRRARGPGAASYAAQGGEDYELLLAVPRGRTAAFERACARAGERVTRVGALERGRGVLLIDLHGRPIRGLGGHDHFRARRAGSKQSVPVI